MRAAKDRSESSVRVGGVVLLLVCCGLAWAMWPDGILERPLAQLTLGDLLRMGGSGVLGWIGLWCLGTLWGEP